MAAYDLRAPSPKHTDLARLERGQVAAQFWSIYIDGEMKDSGYARVQLEQFDIARRMIARYPDRLALALTADDIERSVKRGRLASLLGMEGGHAIENSLGALRSYYALGARYMTLTHNVTLDWADAALDSARHRGLTEFGREVVREMNRLGMLVDLSHVSPAVMSQALDVSEAPVIFSHSAARALVDHPRNVPDSILARLPKNGGVVMVTFVPQFVSTEFKVWEDSADSERKALRTAVPDSAERHRQMDAWEKAHPRAQRDAGAGGRSHRPRAPGGGRGSRRHRERLRRDRLRARGPRGRVEVSGPFRRAHPPRLERPGPEEARRTEPAAGTASGRADRRAAAARARAVDTHHRELDGARPAT